jgi:hypothetical protein
MLRRALVLVGLAATTFPLAFGCAEDESTGRRLPIDPGDGSEGGFGGSSGEGGFVDPGPDVCPDATGVYEVAPAQSNLLFLLDRSGSMHLRVTEVDTRWTMTTAGLAGIVAALPDETIGGLQMFPSGDAPVSCCVVTPENYIDCGACGPGELPGPELRCDATVYNPLAVGMAPLLEPQVQTITSTVAASDDEFYWGTPLAPALGGALDGVTSLAMAGVTSVVLLTDGLPTSCNTTDDPGANDIQRALDAATLGVQAGVRTYVVGIDAEAASSDPATDLAINLSLLAQAGGTARYSGCETTDDCAYRVNVDNFEQALADALYEIALEATSCAFDLPVVEGGMPDLDAVNITVESGGQTQTILRDQMHEDGWDYLPGNEQVQLYGAACDTLKNDPSAKIEVVVGCKTQES